MTKVVIKYYKRSRNSNGERVDDFPIRVIRKVLKIVKTTLDDLPVIRVYYENEQHTVVSFCVLFSDIVDLEVY